MPSRSFVKWVDGKPTFDTERFERIFRKQRYKRFVFKPVDGRGGDGIGIGPKMKARDVKALKARILRDPLAYVYEPYLSLSVLDDHLVDVRPLAMVSPNNIVVSPTPFCRGVPVDGDGLVNISMNGSVFAAMVVR